MFMFYWSPLLFLFRSNTWTNAPKAQQGWSSNSGNGTEGWGSSGDGVRGGANNRWGEPQKTAGSAGWEGDSDRSGSDRSGSDRSGSDRSSSGCWNDSSRTNTSSGNTWVGSGGSNTQDQSASNQGSNWGGESVHKPNSQSNSQSWGEQQKSNHHGAQNWGETTPKPSNEWGKGPEPNMSRGNQGSNKPSGNC